MRRARALAVLAAVAVAALSAVAPAAAKRVWEPPLQVPRAELEAAFHCHGEIAPGGPQPLLFVTGTGATGEQGWLIGHGAFEALGHPVCDVDFPDYTTADIQVSVQYLVYAIRREFKLADAAAAHKLQEENTLQKAGTLAGKIVLVP